MARRVSVSARAACFGLLLLGALAACKADVKQGWFACSNGKCPPGQVCQSDGLCHSGHESSVTAAGSGEPKPPSDAGSAGQGGESSMSSGTGAGASGAGGCSASTPGSCDNVAEACRGSAGRTVCDAQGVMISCDAAGLGQQSQTCASARHCQLGLSMGSCAVCLPKQEYRCTGSALERCSADGQQFELVKQCDASAPCNAEAGECTAEKCGAGKFACNGDDLRKCTDDRSAFTLVKTCTANLCDATDGQCDVCVPGTKTCSGNTSRTCDAQGQAWEAIACPAQQGHCVGSGQCVECAGNDDCAAPTACSVQLCDVASGLCETQNLANGMRCMTVPGVCKDGGCVQCLADKDCNANVGACKLAHCNVGTNTCEPQNAIDRATCNNGADVCKAGQCVQCLLATDCDGDPGICLQYECSATNSCLAKTAPDHSDCRAAGRSGVCANGSCAGCIDGSDCRRLSPTAPVCANGNCVECASPSDCVAATCHKATCNSGFCGQDITAWASCASGRVCNATGTCAQSCGNGHVDADEECEIGVGGWDFQSCDSGSCQRVNYQRCTSSRDCAVGCAAGGQCGETCNTTADCPPAPPNSMATCYEGDCALACDNAAQCPKGLSCVTDPLRHEGHTGICLADPTCTCEPAPYGCTSCIVPLISD